MAEHEDHWILFGLRRLDARRFEELCFALLKAEGHRSVRHMGAAGNDRGVDILSTGLDGKVWATQCKRYRSISAKDVRPEIRKVIEKPLEPPPEVYRLAATCDVSRPVEEALREEAAAAPFELTLARTWAATELVDLLQEDHPGIRERFLGPGPPPPPPSPKEALKIWLDRVAGAHRQLMPYFERRGAPLLEHVYVELQLSPHHRRRQVETQLEDLARERLLGRPMSIRQVLDLDPAEHPWVTRRWLLKGDPGSGKTTLLRHLTRTLADAGGEPWVPVFESLPRLLRKPGWLLDRLEQTLDSGGHPGAQIRQALERQAEEGGLVLLLDGLDEVPRELRDDAEQLLVDLAQKWPESPIVVATRPIGTGNPGPEYRELEVLPFDAERRRSFLAQWFGGDGVPDAEGAAAVAGTLEADRSLRELTANPLYLTLVAMLVEDGSEPARHRPRLFDQIFELLEEGRHHQPPAPIRARKVAHDGLRHLAYQLTEANLDAEDAAALDQRLLEDERIHRLLKREWGELREYLNDVAEKTGILGPHDGPEADWRFWHRTFREGLTAESLAEIFECGGEAALCGKVEGIEGDLSHWAEPYALVAGRVPEPDRLVLALIDANRELGLRAMATAQTLRPETLRQVLKLSEQWKQRRDVYLRVPELIDDPDRALALVDQLRHMTRSGTDLFFLERATTAVGGKWPAARRAAEALLGRLYDHIPPPPEDLFLWITTPLEGRVELWREIPAGKFLMGSPRGEAGHSESEGPQHEVRIRSPFWMSAVPVTVEQYAAFDPERRLRTEMPENDLRKCPALFINWYEATAFCRWLSASFDWARGARLPTEEEWEYSCRAGSMSRYWSGDEESDLDRVGWYARNSGAHTHRVGEKPANPWGLYDVHGNMWEWTSSKWTWDYTGREGGIEADPSAVNPADLAEPASAERVIRGGGYWDEALLARSACRRGDGPGSVISLQGFRVCLPRVGGSRAKERAGKGNVPIPE